MSPVTHLFISWSIANTCNVNRRDRAIITIAGVIPDFDAFGMVFDFLTKNSANPLHWWDKFHHILGHNLGFVLLLIIMTFCFASRRFVTASIVALVFHVHLFCDLIGARGPDGYQWPIPYLSPFSDKLQLSWDGQWALNAYPNFIITGVVIILIFYLAWKKGFSILELISKRADQKFVDTLQKRFGMP